MSFAIRVDNLGKRYRLGQTHRGSIRELVNRNWKRLVGGKEQLLPHEHAELLTPADNQVDADGSFWALRDVSFEVQPGEVVGIIGRNGSGKSTLLKILSQITSPTTGRVELHGRVASLLEVGTGFHPELSGRENVFLNGAILGMTKAEIRRRFDEIVAFAEIEKFIDTPVKRYSSGMYVRLAFAVAAHLEPEILLVDEVLAVGDVAFQRKCLGKMEDVALHGRTILFVSHSMAAVRRLCSRAILLELGNVEAAGEAEQVISAYLDRGAAEIAAVVSLPPGAPGESAAATQLRFLGLDGSPRAQFRIGDKWRIALAFDIHAPLRHVIAAVGIVTFDGVPITTFWSQPRDLSSGHYSVEFLFDIPLAACSLQFVVGISVNERPIYHQSNLGHVAIMEIAEGEQPFRASGTGLIVGRQESEIQLVER